MCLVFISFQTRGMAPVMIGANREEHRRRPRTSPVCCQSGSRRCLLAGADFGSEGSFPALGTWLGVNDAGLTVAVTNRGDGELPWAEQYRSRGLLAVNLLQYDDPGRAAARLSRSSKGAALAVRISWSPIPAPRSSCMRPAPARFGRGTGTRHACHDQLRRQRRHRFPDPSGPVELCGRRISSPRQRKSAAIRASSSRAASEEQFPRA